MNHISLEARIVKAQILAYVDMMRVDMRDVCKVEFPPPIVILLPKPLREVAKVYKLLKEQVSI
jgi:hypothetical protein